MQAVSVTEFGGPEVLTLTEHPDPQPGRGEVVVAVEAADVLFLETMIRSGAAPEGMRPRLPYVPGNGVAGHVLACGEEVDPSWVGTPVAAHTGNRDGYADRVVVPAADLCRIPDGLSATVAAALLHDGPTALALVEVTDLAPGDAVLVVGASGGLGLLMTQLARTRAHRVVATTRGPAKLDRISALDPDAVLDTGKPDWIQAARGELSGRGADVVFDNVGGELGEAAFALAAPGSRFSAHGTPSGRFAAIDPAEAARQQVRLTGIETVQLDAGQFQTYTEQALAAAATGEIGPVIGQTFPLARAAQAHAAIEARSVVGKTLLTP